MRFGGGVVQVLWTVNDDGAATHSAGRPGFGKHPLNEPKTGTVHGQLDLARSRLPG
jgi:hypothetical protein